MTIGCRERSTDPCSWANHSGKIWRSCTVRINFNLWRHSSVVAEVCRRDWLLMHASQIVSYRNRLEDVIWPFRLKIMTSHLTAHTFPLARVGADHDVTVWYDLEMRRVDWFRFRSTTFSKMAASTDLDEWVDTGYPSWIAKKKMATAILNELTFTWDDAHRPKMSTKREQNLII